MDAGTWLCRENAQVDKLFHRDQTASRTSASIGHVQNFVDLTEAVLKQVSSVECFTERDANWGAKVAPTRDNAP
jgi:hypothetical protein